MRRAHVLAVAALVASSSAACSLLGLSDELGPGTCTFGDLAYCASLNDSLPTGDPCRVWQCSTRRMCEVLGRDADGDGRVDALCAPDDARNDCDDHDPNTFRQDSEGTQCDGRDNDCDDWVDEAVLGVASDLVQMQDPMTTNTGVAYAHAAGTAGAALVFTQQGSPADRPMAAVLGDVMTGADARPLFTLKVGRDGIDSSPGRLVSVASAISDLPGGDFAVLAIDREGCERPLLARMGATTQTVTFGGMTQPAYVMRARTDAYNRGLPDVDGGGCAPPACNPDAECAMGEICNVATSLCEAPCMTRVQCPIASGTTRMRCETRLGACVNPSTACATMPTACAPLGASWACGAASGFCEHLCDSSAGVSGCAADERCQRLPGVTSSPDGLCVPRGASCDPSADCGASETCVVGAWMPGDAVPRSGRCARSCTGTGDCPATATCDTTAGLCGPTTTTDEPARTPAVATLGRDVLAAYVRPADGAPERSCGGSAPEAPVLLNRATAPDSPMARTLDVDPSPALVLGQTRDPSPPALLAVPGVGWLAGYVDAASNELRIHLVTPGAPGLVVMRPALYTVAATAGMPQGDVTLALGPTAGDRITVGLAFRSGCGADARVSFGLFALSASTHLFLDVTSAPAPIEPATAMCTVPAGEQHPTLTYADALVSTAAATAARGSWIVAYLAGADRALARRFDATGRPVPEPPFELVTSGAGTRLDEPPFAFAVGTDARVGVLVPVAVEPGGPGGIYRSVIACGGTAATSCR